VTAVDSSSKGLEKARSLAQKNDVEIKTEVADLATYDLGNHKWDAIVSIFAHLPPPLRKKVHSQIKPALKPNGLFLLEAYSPEQLQYKTGGPPMLELLMSAKDLTEELGKLELNLCQEIIRDVHEGVGHIGQGAVVQLIGQNSKA
jgi:2-polyprenyl-3-methyl-5-hydroxy-6-metoxy-1,4-benzoquinol methylase